MNLAEVKKRLDKMFSHELWQGSERNIIFWYGGDKCNAAKCQTNRSKFNHYFALNISDKNQRSALCTKFE